LRNSISEPENGLVLIVGLTTIETITLPKIYFALVKLTATEKK
jgi:hypothetical protein